MSIAPLRSGLACEKRKSLDHCGLPETEAEPSRLQARLG
jgi:hypothetical protein